MTTSQIPKASPAPASLPGYEFRWEQDDRQRVLQLSGVIDSTAASHLDSAIINLGSRRLLIDLSEVSSLDPSGADAVLALARRLGAGRVSVLVDPENEFGVVLTEMADTGVLSRSA